MQPATAKPSSEYLTDSNAMHFESRGMSDERERFNYGAEQSTFVRKSMLVRCGERVAVQGTGHAMGDDPAY
jgi:hypothetical protein